MEGPVFGAPPGWAMKKGVEVMGCMDSSVAWSCEVPVGPPERRVAFRMLAALVAAMGGVLDTELLVTGGVKFVVVSG